MIETFKLDLDYMTEEIGIDKSAILELLKIYSTEMSDEMQQIKLFMNSKEWDSLQKTIHNVKGVSANLYLEDMFKASEALDIKLKKQDYINLESLTQDLFDVFDATNKEIKTLISNCGTDSQG